MDWKIFNFRDTECLNKIKKLDVTGDQKKQISLITFDELLILPRHTYFKHILVLTKLM